MSDGRGALSGFVRKQTTVNATIKRVSKGGAQKPTRSSTAGEGITEDGYKGGNDIIVIGNNLSL